MPQRTIDSVVGPITIEARDGRLTAIRIGTPSSANADGGEDDPVVIDAANQIQEYFAGRRMSFDLPLAPAPSSRGESLRAAISGIGYGRTRTYGALARDAASAPRAIGQACRLNPFPIVVPCHRVTSKAGAEHYSAGAGAMTKRLLLAHEAQRPIATDPAARDAEAWS